VANGKFSVSRRHLLAATAILVTGAKSKTAEAFARPPRDGGGVPCYLRGTAIRTPEGEREVSKLRIGDLVVAYSGQSKPIKWIGRRRVTRDQQTWAEDVVPVMIARNALDAATPRRDLYLSAGHAVYVDGLLVQAGALVNGRTIVRHVPDGVDVLDYFQIELFDHDVILAEGAPAETYFATNDRRSFDNWAEYVALYGAGADAERIPFAQEISLPGRRKQLGSRLRSALAPWVDVRRPIDKVRDRLEDRAVQLETAA
jgi:hypothetical protein